MMRITGIELINFRNHPHLVLREISDVLIIVGDNAIGKTNIIEAIQLLSMHESFRKPKIEELVYKEKQDSDTTCISLDLEKYGAEHTKQIVISDTGKIYYYDKKERPAKELLNTISVVLFTPDDLQIVKGPPEQRRELLDSLGGRLSKSFAQIRADYQKALRQKNSLLKQEYVDRELLESWNLHLAKLGTSLSRHRSGLFDQLMEKAARVYKTISGGEQLDGHYCVSWLTQQDECAETYENKRSPLTKMMLTDEQLYGELTGKMEEELLLKRSLAGPHKDDVFFYIGGNDARRFASQGQQRSIALALKFAEIEILRQMNNDDSLLLLDDVMSELDTNRRTFFLDLIKECSQTVITTTNLGYFNEEFLEKATVVALKSDRQEAREGE